jgi:hypothetical protein
MMRKNEEYVGRTVVYIYVLADKTKEMWKKLRFCPVMTTREPELHERD